MRIYYLVACQRPYLSTIQTGVIMNTTDSSMKKTMTILMVSLFGMFLSIITLAKYIAQ